MLKLVNFAQVPSFFWESLLCYYLHYNLYNIYICFEASTRPQHVGVSIFEESDDNNSIWSNNTIGRH